MRDWLKRLTGTDDGDGEERDGLSVAEQAVLMAEEDEEPTREKQLKALQSIDDRLQESNRRAVISGLAIGTVVTAVSTATIVAFQTGFEHAVEVASVFGLLCVIVVLYAVIKLFFSGS